MNNKKEFLKLVSKKDPKTLEAIKWRQENRAWLKRSQFIALKVLRTLRAKKLTQKQLAEMLGVSPQQVNKWVKGKENFTLDTISKLEKALDIQLIFTEKPKTTFNINFTIVNQKIGMKYNNDSIKKEAKVIPIDSTNSWSSNQKYPY